MTTPKDITLNTLNTIVLPQLKACRNRQELNNYLASAVEEGHIASGDAWKLTQLWELQNGVLKEGQRLPYSRRPADVVPSMEKVMEDVRENAAKQKEKIYQRNSKHPLKVADLVKLENITYGNGKALNSDESGATGMMLVTATSSSNLSHYVVGKNVETGEEVWFKVKWKGEDGDWVALDLRGIAGGWGGLRASWKPTLMAA